MCTSEYGTAGKNVVTLLQQSHERRKHGAHSGSRSNARFRSFQQAHFINELLNTGIAEPAVNVVVRFISECGAHIFSIFKSKTAGKEQRGGMLHFTGSLCLRSNSLCAFMLLHGCFV